MKANPIMNTLVEMGDLASTRIIKSHIVSVLIQAQRVISPYLKSDIVDHWKSCLNGKSSLSHSLTVSTQCHHLFVF